MLQIIFPAFPVLVKKLQLNKYDAVIQAGIAGTFNPGILLGETVLVQKDFFADQHYLQILHKVVELFKKKFLDPYLLFKLLEQMMK